MKVKRLLRKFAKGLSRPAVKSAIITGVVVAGVAIGSTALVLGLNSNSEDSLAEHTNQNQVPGNAANLVVEDNSQQTKESSSPTTQQPNSGSNSNQKNTTSTNQEQSNNTASTPQPTPEPTSLTTCVYQGAPHNGEYCPYSPPPAWNGSFSKYVCMNYFTMVACPSYRDMTQLVYSGQVQYFSDINSYAAQCYFRTTSGDIQRVVLVDTNGATTGTVDCLTARPI